MLEKTGENSYIGGERVGMMELDLIQMAIT